MCVVEDVRKTEILDVEGLRKRIDAQWQKMYYLHVTNAGNFSAMLVQIRYALLN